MSNDTQSQKEGFELYNKDKARIEFENYLGFNPLRRSDYEARYDNVSANNQVPTNPRQHYKSPYERYADIRTVPEMIKDELHQIIRKEVPRSINRTFKKGVESFGDDYAMWYRAAIKDIFQVITKGSVDRVAYDIVVDENKDVYSQGGFSKDDKEFLIRMTLNYGNQENHSTKPREHVWKDHWKNGRSSAQSVRLMPRSPATNYYENAFATLRVWWKFVMIPKIEVMRDLIIQRNIRW